MLNRTIANKSFLVLLADILEISLILFALSWVLKTYILGLAKVEDKAMQPTLPPSSLVAIYKGTNELERGEIIQFSSSESASVQIKRVLGVPGDKVEIKNGLTFINNQPIYEPYQLEKIIFDLPTVIVPPDHIFVMNDNRYIKDDSRFTGMVPMQYVKGKVFFCYWPLTKLSLFL